MSTPPDKQAGRFTPASETDPAPRPCRRVFTAEYKLAIVDGWLLGVRYERGGVT